MDDKIQYNASCLHCVNILGCPMLSDAKGTFVLERVIRLEHRRGCKDYGLINDMQHEIRKTLVGIQGDNAFRILHRVGTIINDDDKEGANEMMDDMPDFAGMLQQGMMTADREEQLRYETDENGVVVPEDLGNGETIKRPRPTYQLRKFACNPEGYIQLDHSTGMFQTQDWLIKHILKIEINNGLLVHSKRSKSAATEKEAAPQQETKDMAVGRKVLTRKGKGTAPKGPKGPKTGGAKVGKPPKKSVAASGAGGDDAPNALPGATAFDTDALAEEIQVKIGETVARVVEEKIAELTAQVEEARSQLMDAITIFHDFMIQTGGSMAFENDEGETETLPEMFDNENKILGHLDGDPQ